MNYHNYENIIQNVCRSNCEIIDIKACDLAKMLNNSIKGKELLKSNIIQSVYKVYLILTLVKGMLMNGL